MVFPWATCIFPCYANNPWTEEADMILVDADDPCKIRITNPPDVGEVFDD